MIHCGHKIYFICPLLDQNDKLIENEEGAIYSDVTSRYEEFCKIYPGQVALIHGKIKSDHKEDAKQQFKDGNIKTLIVTTVIEVGIYVLDATLIRIEDAENFGLA